jgi:uncharacterized protein YjbJ (UPF0337 family)
MINAQELQGQWNQIRGELKQRWGQLTEDDLTIHQGNVDQLVGKIQQRTGESREAIEQFLDKLTARASAGASDLAETARQYALKAGAYAEQAGERLREGYGQAYGAAREQYMHAEDMVRHHPGQSVAVAFGLGVVVGVVVGLALRSR